MASVSIITVTMNHLPLLKRYLESVSRYVDDSHDVEMLIVDNCSTDGTVEFVRQHYPWVRLFVNNRVRGFAANNNFAIRHSRGEYLVLLNPDIELLPKALDNLLGFMESHPDVGLAGPKLLNQDLTVQYSSRRFINAYTLLLRLLNWGADTPRQERLIEYLMKRMDRRYPQPVDWLIGAAMIVRRQAAEEVGLMDEKYFLYIEDQDWCYRMWKAGWKVYYLPNAQMIHVHQRASVRRVMLRLTYHHARSLFYFLLKHRIIRIPPPGPFLTDWQSKTSRTQPRKPAIAIPPLESVERKAG